MDSQGWPMQAGWLRRYKMMNGIRLNPYRNPSTVDEIHTWIVSIMDESISWLSRPSLPEGKLHV